jgi:hypothetical protein
VNLGRCGKGPPFLSVARNNLCNLIGELFLNAAIGFCRQLRPLGDGARSVVSARAVTDWKAPGQIAHFIDQSSMRIGDVECLY